ncbi:uncharacterized protein LOC114934538 [Nylanderia fulva]|uniref:uncharacterized protein LOC114934538 n=1 Tax=Nylanderia fulva TaxID=613905 RepID=UPI0010FB297A|nr:uncharacterized protein LOC114934538 [Nylanderia fulva]
MSEIRHDFWEEEIFPLYESIDPNMLSTLIQRVENLKKDLSYIKGEFDKVSKQNHKSSKEHAREHKIVLDKMTRTISDKQQNTVISEKTGYTKAFDIFYDKLKEEISEKHKKIDLTKQEMTDTPRKIEVKTQYDIKLQQFYEIMYQNEIRRIIGQLDDHGKRYFPTGIIKEKKLRANYKVQLATKEEYLIYRLHLINLFLTLEERVLSLKLKSEHFTTNMKAGVEMPNLIKTDNELSRLRRDYVYLKFNHKMRHNDISYSFMYLINYCLLHEKAYKEEEIINFRNFYMQQIEKIKKSLGLKKEEMAFNLQIKQEATNVETNDTETTNMSDKSENVKSMLMKRNEYLQNFVMENFNKIKRIRDELNLYNNLYNSYKLPNIGTDTNIKTDCVEKSSELPKNILVCQVYKAKFQRKFIDMYNKLKMDLSSYDILNYNVKIDMKPESYDKSTKIHDEPIKEREYLGFIATKHLKTIREVCALFEIHLNRFNDNIENITGCNKFMNQEIYVAHQIFVLEGEISQLKHEVLDYKCWYNSN